MPYRSKNSSRNFVFCIGVWLPTFTYFRPFHVIIQSYQIPSCISRSCNICVLSDNRHIVLETRMNFYWWSFCWQQTFNKFSHISIHIRPVFLVYHQCFHFRYSSMWTSFSIQLCKRTGGTTFWSNICSNLCYAQFLEFLCFSLTIMFILFIMKSFFAFISISSNAAVSPRTTLQSIYFLFRFRLLNPLLLVQPAICLIEVSIQTAHPYTPVLSSVQIQS